MHYPHMCQMNQMLVIFFKKKKKRMTRKPWLKLINCKSGKVKTCETLEHNQEYTKEGVGTKTEQTVPLENVKHD